MTGKMTTPPVKKSTFEQTVKLSITPPSTKTPLPSTITNVTTLAIYQPGGLTNLLQKAKVDNNLTDASSINPNNHIVQANQRLPRFSQIVHPKFNPKSNDGPIIIPDDTEGTDWVDNEFYLPVIWSGGEGGN